MNSLFHALHLLHTIYLTDYNMSEMQLDTILIQITMGMNFTIMMDHKDNCPEAICPFKFPYFTIKHKIQNLFAKFPYQNSTKLNYLSLPYQFPVFCMSSLIFI